MRHLWNLSTLKKTLMWQFPAGCLGKMKPLQTTQALMDDNHYLFYGMNFYVAQNVIWLHNITKPFKGAVHS